MCSRDAVVADRDRAASAPRSGVRGAAKKTRCQSGSIDRGSSASQRFWWRGTISDFELRGDGRKGRDGDGSDVGSFNARVRYDVCIVWFFGGVVVINLSPLVCCVREIATLLKSL